MLLRLGGLAVPMECVVAVLDVEAASDNETAAFFRHGGHITRHAQRAPGERWRSVVLAREDGADVLYYSSVSARTLLRRANGRLMDSI